MERKAISMIWVGVLASRATRILAREVAVDTTYLLRRGSNAQQRVSTTREEQKGSKNTWEKSHSLSLCLSQGSQSQPRMEKNLWYDAENTL
jgi:hypothetical protein